MFEYLAIFAIVRAAFWFVVKALIREGKGTGCSGCDCSTKEKGIRQIIPIATEKWPV